MLWIAIPALLSTICLLLSIGYVSNGFQIARATRSLGEQLWYMVPFITVCVLAATTVFRLWALV
jgi:hypothetical protein